MRKASETSSNRDSDARYTLVVQRDLLEDFRLVAKRNDRTLQGELRNLMREAVEREQQEAAA